MLSYFEQLSPSSAYSTVLTYTADKLFHFTANSAFQPLDNWCVSNIKTIYHQSSAPLETHQQDGKIRPSKSMHCTT